MTRFTGVLLETSVTLPTTSPNIPIKETVLSELGDPNPVFVSLPIGKVNVVSRNGRKYPRSAIEAIVNTINKESVIGQRGHLRDEERPYRFDVPPLMWMGATIDPSGTAWAKAYIMKHAADVREYIQLAGNTKAKVGTSIYGTANVDDDGTVNSLEIESIDLAHPARLGVLIAGSTPVVTQETDMSNQYVTKEAQTISALKQKMDGAVSALKGVLAEIERDLGIHTEQQRFDGCDLIRMKLNNRISESISEAQLNEQGSGQASQFDEYFDVLTSYDPYGSKPTSVYQKPNHEQYFVYPEEVASIIEQRQNDDWKQHVFIPGVN